MTEKTHKNMTGGEAICEMLKLHKCEYMFGIAGFQLLPLYDAIQRNGNVSPRHINVTDERTAAFAADAFARVSGKPGLCDGTLGPGATNLLTGLVESSTAGIPVVAMIGGANRDHCDKNMTQEVCQEKILSPIAKELINIERGHRIPEFVRRAFNTATSGKPGPVILSIPEDIVHGTWSYPVEDFYVHDSSLSVPSRRIRPDYNELKKACSLILKSERPVVLAGGGIHISDAYDELLNFCEKLNIPVAHTLSGKGCLPCKHPLNINLFGRYDRVANELIKNSDLLIAVGFKFGEIATIRYSLIPQDVDIIQIDASSEEINKHQKTSIGLWADCKLALADFIQELESDLDTQQEKRKDYINEILNRKQMWKEQLMQRLTSDEKPINMARLCHDLSEAMPEDGILVADGGFAAHWTGIFYDVPESGRRFVANRGNASIGYGLPGGIGAQFGAVDNTVVTITGDGGLNMTLGELETIVRENIPLTVIVVNNSSFGYVKALQHHMFNGRYQSSDLEDMNYANIAQAMGCRGVRIDDPKDLKKALKEGISDGSSPVVIDVRVTRDPAHMLPSLDARTSMATKKGDRLM